MTSTIPAVTTRPAVAARATDLVKTYGRGAAAVRALDGASVAVDAGRLTAVMGPSGSGTSTLVHACSWALTKSPTAGMNVSSEPAMIPGSASGSVTRRNA